MGTSNKLRMKLGRAVGLSAMALAAISGALPTSVMAQERDFRGAGRIERRMDAPSRPTMPNRMERPRDFGQQRGVSPRSAAPDPGAARVENRGLREFRGDRARNDGPRRQWRGQANAPTGGTTWQQQRQGIRGTAPDARTVEQWRERRQNRPDGQPGHVDGTRDPWRDRGEWRNGDRRDTRPAWQNNRPGWQDGRRNDAWRDNGRGNGWRNDRGGNRAWDRGWRSNDRYDWSSYRARNRGVYHLGRYAAPYASYRYNRLGVGFTMGSLFYGRNYWLSDPWQYRLPGVYGPYRWVRYYDDVVLVDTYTGEVVDVIYDFFW
jgi:Nickel/cobalt transporter regulator